MAGFSESHIRFCAVWLEDEGCYKSQVTDHSDLDVSRECDQRTLVTEELVAK